MKKLKSSLSSVETDKSGNSYIFQISETANSLLSSATIAPYWAGVNTKTKSQNTESDLDHSRRAFCVISKTFGRDIHTVFQRFPCLFCRAKQCSLIPLPPRFAAFSVFTVKAVEWSAHPDDDTPHVITVVAAIDNRKEPEDLPLLPWY